MKPFSWRNQKILLVIILLILISSEFMARALGHYRIMQTRGKRAIIEP